MGVDTGLQHAWRSGELLFPATPKLAGKRWFLRTPVNPENSQDLVFIGINPSSATRFSTQKLGGDRTTEMIVKYFSLNVDGSPRDWHSMTIINLIPLIGQPEELPAWDTGSGRQKILDSLKITEQIFQEILPVCPVVHLMWGDPDDKNFPWKNPVLKLLIPEINSLVSADYQVQAYLSKNGYPMHPGFGGLAYWRDKELLDAHHLLENQ